MVHLIPGTVFPMQAVLSVIYHSHIRVFHSHKRKGAEHTMTASAISSGSMNSPCSSISGCKTKITGYLARNACGKSRVWCKPSMSRYCFHFWYIKNDHHILHERHETSSYVHFRDLAYSHFLNPFYWLGKKPMKMVYNGLQNILRASCMEVGNILLLFMCQAVEQQEMKAMNFGLF